MAATQLLVPARSMPVAPQIGMVLGHHHDMAVAHLDESVASGAEVTLAGGVRLHREDDFVVEGAQPAKAAHTTRAAATVKVTTTSTMSAVERRRTRNGLKPMTPWYERGRFRGARSGGLRR